MRSRNYRKRSVPRAEFLTWRQIVTGIVGPGYIDEALKDSGGLQTDKPLKRAFMPHRGEKMKDKANCG